MFCICQNKILKILLKRKSHTSLNTGCIVSLFNPTELWSIAMHWNICFKTMKTVCEVLRNFTIRILGKIEKNRFQWARRPTFIIQLLKNGMVNIFQTSPSSMSTICTILYFIQLCEYSNRVQVGRSPNDIKESLLVSCRRAIIDPIHAVVVCIDHGRE